MSIKIHIHKPGSTDPEGLEIAEEILVEELLQQVLNGQHEEFDLFSEGRAEPHHRRHRATEAGIKNGDMLYCQPRRRDITVHIDRYPRQSPSVTTGAALYALANVAAGHQLYREARGEREDEPIFNDEEVFHLEENSHFYSTDKVFPGYKIWVNSREKVVHERLLTFDEIIDLAYETRPTGGDIVYTVSFHNAVGRHPEGEMVSTAHSGKHGCHTIKVKDGTVIDVEFTDRS